MKRIFLAASLAASLLVSGQSGAVAATNDVSTDLGVLRMKVNNRLKAGKDTENDLTNELQEFDALLAKYQSRKTDEVAEILYMKAMLYLQVLGDNEKAGALIQQLKREYPDTRFGKTADQLMASLKKQEQAKKISASLVEGVVFPDFNEKDMAGKPLSLSQYKGKVVLIDFWATWCGPCVRELPNVVETYKAYHGEGFEIIGISLDQDRLKLEGFLGAQEMPWPQFFDGKGWENKLAAHYGITGIPATFLLDRQGKIIGKDLRGDSLKQAVAMAMAKK
jgi:thiol-disulfide isomerase/thioredoxin